MIWDWEASSSSPEKGLNMWHGTALRGGGWQISGGRSWWWWLPKKDGATAALLLLFLIMFTGASFLAGFINTSILTGAPVKPIPTAKQAPIVPILMQQQYSLNCTQSPQTCPTDYPTAHKPTNPDRSSPSCPSYFRWIHEDLRPWRDTGITRDMVERARRTAHFRVVIVDGKVYVETYRKSIQSRDMFTLWGILQLLRLYPRRLPDLDLMFDCDDRPVVFSADFHATPPPPLFRYCGDHSTLDIVFPDWSFWGWAEINIKPWRNVLKDIKEGNKRTKWKERLPYAYWKGNPHVAPTRKDLLKCNASHWSTLLYIQDWDKESKQGYKQSNLEDQCTHRYKIYIEGWAWSVSEKYILACDSMTLLVRPHYYDFFIRGMLPLQHYWPIRDNTKCTSLQFAVHWGNNHTQKAQAIGEAASNFIQDDLSMDNVYDYMFHLLNEYAKLLKFKPTIPPGGKEVCSETMACPTNGNWRKFMEESLVKSPHKTVPCTMPPPYDQASLEALLATKANTIHQVEMWEDEYWKNRKQ